MPRPIDKIVVEGMIELDEYPIVFITKNAAYFDIVDTAVVNNSIIYGNKARVIVSNGDLVDTLTPATFNRWPYYGYIGTKFKGSIHGQYDLQIIYNSLEYYATTTIPDTVAIDSVWADPIGNIDSLCLLSAKWQDPDFLGNYYTLVTKVHVEQNWFYRPFFGFHIIDDKLDNNNPMTFTPLTKGYERNTYYNDFDTTDIEMVQKIAYAVGDTVSIKLQTIDDESYSFWNSWYRNLVTDGNPFTNPATVKTNIYGAPANGYWIGYGTSIITVYITDTTHLEIIK